MFEPLFIECGYCRKSFPFTTTNTSACVIVRGMVMSSKNVRQSWMSFWCFFWMVSLEINGMVETLLVCGNMSDLIRFFVFEPLFIGGKYCRKYFPCMEANTLACVIVRVMVMSLENVKRSWMCPLMLIFNALVLDYWRGGDSSCVYKRR